ncbi:hypothetical protein [Achromobacter piechaudii]|uniref:Uncharacterized protein n=1 Tax=Achromobacter piechaudii ATCC 43553 TaxID=742159 RepID=D4XD55_9BURK|nr:hypothetical protein [Achromobacter piechaudii]EFF75271.1 hypothetical protein HMPREF0004_3402 [Achromobacter piechaudii ATCC 43553]
MSAHDIVITCSQVPMTLDASPSTRDDPFLLVNDDALSRLQASIGLLPARGGAIKRRALAYALVAWLPLAVASWFSAKAGGHDAALNETLLGHYGIHIRCLIAIPLLVLAEGIAQKNLALCLNEFKRSGLVDQALAPRFDAVVEGVARLKKRMFPWIIVGTLAAAWTAVFLISPNPDEVQWAGPRNDSLGFGAWWFLLVSRPLFCVLLLAWIWRLTLVGILLLRIARLPLKLVVMHPDRMGGLGFLDRLPMVYAPFLFSVSAVVAGAWAHTVFYHGVTVPSLYLQVAMLLIVLILIGLAPLLMFSSMLARAKRQALLDYGDLLSEHGRLVDARWIRKERIAENPILDAPELGPVADIQALYQAVNAMRPAVISKSILIKIVLPSALPLLILVATQWPVKSTLSKLFFTLL